MSHASITTTLNLYGHLYPGEMDRYADRLNEATGMSDATDDVAKMRPDDDANRIGYDVTIGVIWGFGGALGETRNQPSDPRLPVRAPGTVQISS
jgi:hypothetical protein